MINYVPSSVWKTLSAKDYETQRSCYKFFGGPDTQRKPPKDNVDDAFETPDYAGAMTQTQKVNVSIRNNPAIHIYSKNKKKDSINMTDIAKYMGKTGQKKNDGLSEEVENPKTQRGRIEHITQKKAMGWNWRVSQMQKILDTLVSNNMSDKDVRKVIIESLKSNVF